MQCKRAKYEDALGNTKLEDCGSVKVEIRNGEVGVKCVKDCELDWLPL